MLGFRTLIELSGNGICWVLAFAGNSLKAPLITRNSRVARARRLSIAGVSTRRLILAKGQTEGTTQTGATRHTRRQLTIGEASEIAHVRFTAVGFMRLVELKNGMFRRA
jgi:hypothetical protein